MPKVSVLVPIYNVEKYLRQCLDSLINQTLEDIEIICINDGSTDSSPEIISEYQAKDNRVKVINKANSGYGASMNMGVDAATGEYIGIVESDDYAENTMFEKLYNQAKANDLDILKSDFVKYWGDTNQCVKAGIIDKDWCDKVFTTDEYKEALNIIPSIWSAIYRKEFIQTYNIRFSETAGASYQDTGWHYKTMLVAKRIMLTNEAYLYYRQDNPNSSVKSTAKAYAVCKEFESIVDFMKSNNCTKNLEYVYSIMFRSYRHNLLRLDEALVDEFIQYYSDKFKQIYKTENLGDLFFSRCKKKELLLLINNPKQYYKKYKQYLMKEKIRRFRKKLLSINISKQRVSITLFGREIVRIG